jgi:hypothetical protein
VGAGPKCCLRFLGADAVRSNRTVSARISGWLHAVSVLAGPLRLYVISIVDMLMLLDTERCPIFRAGGQSHPTLGSLLPIASEPGSWINHSLLSTPMVLIGLINSGFDDTDVPRWQHSQSILG